MGLLLHLMSAMQLLLLQLNMCVANISVILAHLHICRLLSLYSLHFSAPHPPLCFCGLLSISRDGKSLLSLTPVEKAGEGQAEEEEEH